MKPIVEKILKAGLVDKHTTQLMEKWGQIDRGASDLVGADDLKKASEESLTQFAEEVEMLIEKDREELRETRLAIQVGEPMLVEWTSKIIGAPSFSGDIHMNHNHKIVVFKDNAGNFIFPLLEKNSIYPGAAFQTKDGERWEILDSSVLYIGEQPYAIQVSV